MFVDFYVAYLIFEHYMLSKSRRVPDWQRLYSDHSMTAGDHSAISLKKQYSVALYQNIII